MSVDPRSARVRSFSDVSAVAGLGKCLLIAAGFVVMFISSGYAFAHHGYGYLLFLAVVPLTAWTQHAIAEEIHDGVHYRLFPSRGVNDLVSKVYAALLGFSFTSFRAAHLHHHRHFGTPDDPDYHKYVYCPHTTWEWVRFVAWNFSGVGAVAAQVLPKKRLATTEYSVQHPFGTAALQVLLWGLSLLLMPWWAYPLIWVGTLVTLSNGVTQLRTTMEHYNDTGKPGVGALFDLTGTVSANLFAGQFGYNNHGTHHIYPSIPNYRLHALARQQLYCDKHGQQLHRMNYFVRLHKLFWRKTK